MRGDGRRGEGRRMGEEGKEVREEESRRVNERRREEGDHAKLIPSIKLTLPRTAVALPLCTHNLMSM